MNGDNLNIVRCETSRTFRNKRREYLKDKINELETKRTKVLETWVETLMNLSWTSNLELTW
jgi:hypothetical protein